HSSTQGCNKALGNLHFRNYWIAPLAKWTRLWIVVVYQLQAETALRILSQKSARGNLRNFQTSTFIFSISNPVFSTILTLQRKIKEYCFPSLPLCGMHFTFQKVGMTKIGMFL